MTVISLTNAKVMQVSPVAAGSATIQVSANDGSTWTAQARGSAGQASTIYGSNFDPSENQWSTITTLTCDGSVPASDRWVGNYAFLKVEGNAVVAICQS